MYGISIVTAFIATILILLSSYQEYMVNKMRENGNWEARFNSIKYTDVLKIAEDKNIKEVSIYYDYGASTENLARTKASVDRIHLMGYDANALNNSKLKIIEGKLPEKNNEIVISEGTKSKFGIEIGTEISLTFEEKRNNYFIVGIVKTMSYDKDIAVYDCIYGAITLLNTESLNKEDIVNASILTKNIKEICKTVNSLERKLELNKIENENKIESIDINTIEDKNIINLSKGMSEVVNGMIGTEDNSTEDKSKEKVNYNMELLEYAGVREISSSFNNMMLILRNNIDNNSIYSRNNHNLHFNEN